MISLSKVGMGQSKITILTNPQTLTYSSTNNVPEFFVSNTCTVQPITTYIDVATSGSTYNSNLAPILPGNYRVDISFTSGTCLGSPNATINFDIIPKTLNIVFVPNNKVYDGNIDASSLSLTSDKYISDNIIYNSAIPTFDNKNVGVGKTVSLTGIYLTGVDAGNYTLTSTTVTATGSITARSLTVSATATNKPYDGNTSVSINLSNNRLAGDILTISNTSANFDNKNVGTGKTVTVGGVSITGGTDAGNYSLTNVTATTTASITAKSLTVSATATNKPYDGNTTAVVSLSDDRLSGDILTIGNTSANFDNKNVGTGKTVTIGGVSITGGTDAGNYSLTNVTTTTTASITAKSLTVSATATNKPYDGNTTAVVSLSDDRLSGDILTIGNTSANFDNKNVGTGKTVTIGGVSITGGTDAGNYSLTNVTATTTADITPKSLGITGLVANNKPYDGNTVATVNGTPAYDGLVTADAGFTTVQFNSGGPSFNFDTKDAGTAKPITVTGYTAPSTNYTLTQPTGLTANITPAPITIAGISGANKVYDRNTTASVTGTPIYIGLVAGENLNVVGTPTYSFANKKAGTAKPITVSGFTAPNGNYTLSAQPTGITADITPKLLTVTGTVPVRVYDATTNTPGLVLNNDRITGDIVNVSRTSAAFENPNAGVNKNILLSGINIISGDDGENYFLANPNITIQGTITPLSININANDAIKTELDPDPVFTFTHSPALYTPEVFTGALSRIPGETPADYPLTIGSLSAGNNYTLNLNSAKLTIKPLVTNYIFEVPNAFTPNLDGTNDLLKIIKNYRVTGLNYFRIYNRTGQLVFETNNLAQGWNGRRMGDMSGNVLESDLYIWVAEFTRMNDSGGGVSIERKTGSVLLLK
jgi:gliding motility-associated-like protein